jgi:Pyruvate/2-oxoacid:ferredoxin oxidoreductase delta subunit/flavodoxin
MEIYYFSGTGNSLTVARELAGRVGGRLVSIPTVMHKDHVTSDAEALGFVFLVYHKSIPLILKRFVEKLEGLGGRYVFAVSTYGDTPGLAIDHLQDLIQARGGALTAGFGVHMPYNYVTPAPVLRGFFRSFSLREVPLEKQRTLIAQAPQRIETIVASVEARERGAFEISADPITRLTDRLDLPETVAKPIWLRIAGVEGPTDLSFLESRQLMDHAFRADERCNGCAVCARICPVRNVEMVGDRPAWRHRCEQCFACLQWCPKEAIQFRGNTSGQRRYHHPDVTLADMVRSAPKA